IAMWKRRFIDKKFNDPVLLPLRWWPERNQLPKTFTGLSKLVKLTPSLLSISGQSQSILSHFMVFWLSLAADGNL
ncbi:MAG: hypothetical protein RIB86_03720, partial [Imperialibacter sp.]